jgi:transcriptional regulator with XRE-family HTH domain
MSNNVKRIGKTIKELRKKLGITGEELGRRANLSQSKISKIETGFYSTLRQEDVKNILNILQAPSTITQQVLADIDQIVSPQFYKIFSEDYFKFDYKDRERAANHIRIYTTDSVPALLQTVAYRRGSLSYKGVKEDLIPSCIKSVQARQDLLWDSKHSFYFIVPQTVLYTLATSKSEHLLQLDRLERIALASDAGIHLGIIPLEAGTVLLEHGSFALYDDHTLVQVVTNREIVTTSRDEVKLHSDLFAALENLAFYGKDAIELVRKAMDYFS